MVQRILLNHYLARTAGMLSGARRASLMLLVMLLTTSTAWATITGSGVVTNPYVINDDSDWSTFATESNAATYWASGVYVKLGANIGSSIPVTTMVGTSSNKFKGTFDGAGHMLTVNYTVTDPYVAPFRYVNGATVKNLHVAGTITTSNQYAGGLMSEIYGDCTISNCWSSVTITSSKNGDGTHGGFMAYAKGGNLTITNSLFDGKLLTTNGTNNCGGFVGWCETRDGARLTVINSLFAPSEVSSGMGQNTISRFRTGYIDPTITNTYYTQTFGDAQGDDASSMEPDALAAYLNNGGEEWQVSGSSVVPVMVQDPTKIQYATISGVQPSYFYTGSAISITPTVIAADGTVLAEGTHYTVTIKNSNNQVVTSVTAEGDYTLTITGTGTKGNGYYGSQIVSFTIVQFSIDNSFNQDEAGYYYINMPGVGTNTINLDLREKSDGFAFNIYDDGGKGEWRTGTYWKDGTALATKGSHGYIKITAPAGFVIQLTGKVMTQSYDAYLTVYDGGDTNCNTLCANVYGDNESREKATVNIGTLVSTGNTMLVYFCHEDNWNAEGLWLTAKLVSTNTESNIGYADYSNGTVTAYVNNVAVTSAVTNAEVTLSVAPNEGYIINYITVKDENNNSIPVTGGWWYGSSTSATFTMPASTVTVTPVFIATNNMTASNGLRYDASSNVNSISMGNNVHSFSIYAKTPLDLAVSAGDGNKLIFEGGVSIMANGDGLIIYDGSNSSAAQLYKQMNAPDNISKKSTGTSMYFNAVANSTLNWFQGTIAQIYTINYVLAGGTVADANPSEYTCESAAFTLNNPTTETVGYEFAGWTGTGLDAASTTVTIAKGSYGTRTYTATWKPIDYTITYEGLDGATIATANPTSYNIESDDFTLTNPTRDGYTFAGWTGTGLTEATTTVTIAHGSTGDRSYTATWTENIAYIKNGNTAYCTNYTVLDNTMTTISAGWYVVKNDVEFNGNLSTNASGEVHIILCDGATLTANNIEFGHSNYLYIYGQSQGTGTANISGRIEASSSLQIYGGTINVTDNIMCPQSSVGIYGGNVTAEGIDSFRGLNFTGGTITAGTLKVSEEGDLLLGGATVKANSYNVKNGNVTIATGKTYYDGTGASYTEGNLTSDQISAIRGKTLTPSNTFSVTANEDPAHAGEYWSTFYHPVAGYTVPSGTTAYIGTLNGSTVTLTEVTGGFIPADNAVILKGASASFNLTRAATGDAFDFTGNDLKGGSTVAAGKVPYTLAAKNGTVGFYKFTGAALNPNKAHLEIDPNSSAPGYFGFDEGTTGITNTDFTDSTDKVGAWYTLDGRKLQGMPTQKGLYIVNGKKIVIK